MKKLLAVLAVALLSRFSFADPSTIGTQPPSAGWNFGNVTYGQEGGSLILNSLSDRYGIAQFQTANTNGQSTQLLGTNDYIEENAVKNQLAIDGYTQAYDYNPNATTIYNGVYTTPLPTNVPLTELSFMGLDGDPTKIQNVWVPTSEYNALSAQGQATSISTLNTGLATTNVNVTNNATAITNETVRATGAESTLTNSLNTETNSRVAGDQANATAIAGETVRATSVESGIQNLTDGSVLSNTVNQHTTQISTLNTGLATTNVNVAHNTQSINTLNTGLIATNASLAGTQNMTDGSIITNTVKANTVGISNLNTGLSNETARATGAEAGLQNQVNATNSRVSNLDNRVSQLEKVKVMADLNVRILDTKKYTVGFFDMYDGTNQRNFAFGARLTYKLGKSYEEKVLQTQKKQLDSQASELLELRAMVHNLVVKNPSR